MTPHDPEGWKTPLMTNSRYRGEEQMVLRLVLVGLVAGLGLSLPDRRERDAWGYSAQRWVNARLAEWDTGTTTDSGAFVLVSEPDEATAPSDPAPAAVSDAAFAAVIDETVATFA